MIVIKEKCPTPSSALEAMIRGLQKADRRVDFEIQMDYYLSVSDSDVCFGCAATCTVQEIADKNLTPDMMRNYYMSYLNATYFSAISDCLGFDYEELYDFETAIDDFRTGYPYTLLNNFYKVNNNYIVNKIVQLCINMSTMNWREELLKVDKAITILKSYNL